PTLSRAPAVPSSSAAGTSPRGLERALLANPGPRRPTSASCRRATAAEQHQAPFGATKDPEFSCLIAVNGERTRYDVQVLANGCYVGERVRPGQAVYGCAAGQP